MDFKNDQIDLAALPSIDTVEYTGLNKKYLTAQMVATSLLLLVPLIAFIVLWKLDVLDEVPYPFIIPCLILGLGVIILVFQYFGFKIKSYAVREKDVLYKRGLIFRSQTVVPFHRVQHCEIDQGPLERYFGLKTLKIYTAGGANSDLNIPGLKLDEAESLKTYIIQKTEIKLIEGGEDIARSEEE